jgi:CubicO group peptidase (beta-lactamase class C family)
VTHSRSSKRLRVMQQSVSRRKALKSIAAGSTLAAIPALRMSQSASAQEGTPVALTDAAIDVTPERVAAAVEQIPSLAESLMEQTGIPGMVVGVVYQDAVTYLGSFGVREAGTDHAVDEDTIFQIASLSKAVGSTVVAALVGNGVITWDTKIVDIDPTFALSDPYVTDHVTLADLYSHRSGLPDHPGDLLEDLGFDRTEILHRLRYVELEGAFRASYAYTNFGLTAAAEAAAMAAGTSWEDLSEQLLYEPLGMTRTSSRFDDFASAENHALTHAQQDGEWVAAFIRDPDPQSPAGGVSSTVRDMCQWLRLQLANGTYEGQQIVAPDALGETHLPHIVSRAPENPALEFPGFYGLGWGVSYNAYGDISLSHSGAFALGAATSFYLLPMDQLGIVVLTNAAPVGVPESLALSFLDLARSGEVQNDYLPLIGPLIAASGMPEYGMLDDATPSGDPPLALDAYTGSYANDFFGESQIVEQDDGLAMIVGPRGDEFAMEHFDRDIFSFQPRGENAGGPSAVTFTIGPDDRATQLVVEYFDVIGTGTFERQEIE